MSANLVAETALGRHNAMLAEAVSLATPLTMGRVTGRTRAADILQQIAAAFSISDPPEFIAETPDRDFVTFTGQVEGHPVGLLAALARAGNAPYHALDLYARPWPFVALAREKLAAEHDLFRDDVDLSTPYVPSGPTAAYLEAAPDLPGLAPEVAFHSPILTATATGRDLVAVILQAVGQAYGTPSYHWAGPAGPDAVVALYDGHVHGHVIQIAVVLAFSAEGEIADMRIYSRPWPVTALFRGEVYKLLRGTLGAEFWLGPPPLAALGEQPAVGPHG